MRRSFASFILVGGLAVTPLSCGASPSDANGEAFAPGGGQDGPSDSGAVDAVDAVDAGRDASTDAGASTDARPDGPTPVPCPPGTTNGNLTLAANLTYPAGHLTNSPPHFPFAAICLPFTMAGQGFYLESKVIRSGCNVYDACETSLEIKCVDLGGKPLRPEAWSGENYLNGASSSNMIARMIFRSTAPGPVTCKAHFFNHDHGVVGGTVTVGAGSTFSAAGPLADTATTPASGGGAHLTSARPIERMKPITGWSMPKGMSRVSYIGDIQVTECHVPYPANAKDPTTQCTTSETGEDSTVEYRAQAYEENLDGSTCRLTDGVTNTTTVSERTHHKMLYTQVLAAHTPGCANVWHFQVYTRWKSGKSFMIQSGPYGQGMVRPL